MNIEGVKTLRIKTQAGYADCRRALAESKGNIEEAEEYLRKRGRAVIDSDTATKTESGVIESYIHPGNRVGSIVEIKCQTDFVAKTEEFKTFAKEISMQVASMRPKYLSRAEISLDVISKEVGYRIERLGKEGVLEENLQDKLDAEMEQWYSEVCLLEQAYIKDGKKAIKDLLAELISKMGEKCKITLFERWEIGSEVDELEEEPIAVEVGNYNKFKIPVSVMLTVMSLLSIVAIFSSC